MLHFENKLPNNVELPNLAEYVDNDVVGGGGEEGRGRRREGFGIDEEREGNFGGVLETEESLVEKERREGDAM